MVATVTLTGRKSLTIYHEGVEERFRQGIPRTVRKESLITYIQKMQQGMFAVDVTEEPKPEPKATKAAPPASPAPPDDSDGDGDGDGDDESEANKPAVSAKKPKKRAKVHTE